MEFESAARELYRVPLSQFTAARDTMSGEARQAGQRELAASLKKLRKPSVGAWLANLLVLEQSNDIGGLVDLGAELRTPKRRLDGGQIRKVSKEKGVIVSKLVREARSKALRAGQSVSPAASEELETTLEAAFADPKAAETLLAGRLTNGLQYSGLGLGEQTAPKPMTATKGSASARRARMEADRIAAERNAEKAQHEAEQADSAVEQARRAVADAAREVNRLKSAEALAVRRSKVAHAKVSAAERKLDKLRPTSATGGSK